MLNEGVSYATVEDWMGNELVRFIGGDDPVFEAMLWKEEQVDDSMSEEEADGILEDLYILGFKEDGQEISPLQFG